jgi:hypothetical protein
MNLDRLALEVAREMYDDHISTISLKAGAIKFARRLMGRIAAEAQPVAHAVMSGDTVIQLSVSKDPFYPHSTKLYRHPAPEVIDKSKLKRLVTQVFGIEYHIAPHGDVVPGGMALVPREPTEAMLMQICPASADLREWRENYKAMLSVWEKENDPSSVA